ncbi:terpene synthase family protein [Streptomyces sp. NPDC000405]|uniref:terpene synthase family protein n=1 Tax=Streptomyces sp. NPDC000405 TaxID=3161033 RepID=UPI00398CDB21
MALVHIDISPLYFPYTCTLNEHGPELHKNTLTWMADHSMRLDAAQQREFENYHLTEGVGLFYPSLPAPQVQLAQDWTVAAVLFDALVLERPPVNQDLSLMAEVITKTLKKMQISQTLADDDHPLVKLLADVTRRVRADAPLHLGRWIDGHRAWWLGQLHQQGLALAGRRPSLDHYAHLRQLTIAGPPTVSAMEWIRGFDLSPLYAASPHLRALSEAAALLWGWDNDLFSYVRDYLTTDRQGEAAREVNLIDVIQHENGCTLAEAVEEAVRLRNRVMSLFERLSGIYLPTAPVDVQIHVSDLAESIRGNAEYYRTAGSRRYHTTTSAAPPHGSIAITSTITDIPPPGSREPVPLTSIAWWWQLLG